MKRNILFLTTALSVVLLFAACKKNNSSPEVRYQINTISRSSTVARTLSGTVQWTSGYMNATEIKFEAENNTTEVEYKSVAPQRIDLFAPLTTLGIIALPPGTYTEVDFEVELAPNGSDASLELKGTFTSGVIVTPVIFRVGSALEIESEKDNVTIADNASYTALTSLNLSVLTQGITEAMLNNAQRTNGVIIISAASNTNLYNIILNNIGDMDEVEFDHD